MPTLPKARLRIAADLFHFEDFTDLLRSDAIDYIPKLRAGEDCQLEIAFFDDGVLLDPSTISSLQLEIKPMRASIPETFDEAEEAAIDLRAPELPTAPLLLKTLDGSALNASLTATEWDSLAADKAHAIIALTAAETALAAGDRWLTLSLQTADTPAISRTASAGRLRILGGGPSSA